MKPENVTAVLIVVAVLAILVTIGLVIWRLELRMIFALALIIVLGAVVALIIAASAFPIRARKAGGPHEREKIIRETKHTHTIDGRRAIPPHVVTIPQAGGGLFPDLLRGAYLAGQRLRAGEALPRGEDVIEGDAVELPTDEWTGPIDETRGVTQE